MKRIFLFYLLFLAIINSNAQKLYKEIPSKKVNAEKVNYAKGFISEFLKKCETKNYTTKYSEFKISDHLQTFLDKNNIEVCEVNEKIYGKITLQDINSIYNDRYTNLYNPAELYIFNVSTEKNKEIKYISIWMTQNEKMIDGIWISREKPLKKNKEN